MPTHIAIADERHAQLRQLAKQHNTNLAGALALLINHAIDHGLMEPGLPGIDVRKIRGAVEISADGAVLGTVPIGGALDGFVSELRKVAAGGRPAEMFDADAWLIVARRGSSVKIKNPITGVERAMSPSVAADLADVIDAAIK